MDYKGWILSIYDEYKRIYDKEHNINTKLTFKEAIKILFKKENRKFSVFLLIFIVSLLILLILEITGWYKKATVLIMIEIFVAFIIMYSQNYKHELDIESYRERTDILRRVLEKEKIYNEKFIRYMKDYTGGIFYKVNRNVKEIFKGILTIISITGFNYVILKINKDIAIIISAIIALIIPMGYCIYAYLTMIPNSRIIRRQQFHQILSILIAYDFDSK